MKPINHAKVQAQLDWLKHRTPFRKPVRPAMTRPVIFPRRVHPLTGEEVVNETIRRFNINTGRGRDSYREAKRELAREEREWTEWCAALSLPNNGDVPTLG